MMTLRNQNVKWVTVLVCLFLLTGLFLVHADAQSSAAVDLVIVLDNSSSMYDERPYSDPKGYRFYAAAAMLNMCESESSRAAIIYFNRETSVQKSYGNNTVTMPVSIAFQNTDGSTNYIGRGNRVYFTQALIERDPKQTSGYTYLGTAMQKAVQLLDAGESTRGDNQPIILVLADGDNDTNDATNLDMAIQQAKTKGYKVYPVLLKSSENTDIDESAYTDYIQMAEKTGGIALTLQDPLELPRIFSEIFAAQIGSSLVTVSYKENADKTGYFMDINIPNQSVLEVNILMSLNGVSKVSLANPSGSVGTLDVQTTDIGSRYKLFKIVKPKLTGNWRLSFNAASSALNGIQVTVLYSYNIELQGSVLPIGSQKAYKNSQYRLTAQFFDATAPSTDQNLYLQKITAKAYLVKQGEKIADNTPYVELDPYTNRFEKSVTLEDFGIDSSGDYEIIFHAEGDGLTKESPRYPLHVENRYPVTIAGAIPKSITMNIDNPISENIDEPDTYQLAVNTFVRDEDGDPLTMQITCDDETMVTIQDVDDAALTATLETTGISGSTNIRISVQDPEGGALDSEIVIPVTVYSILDTLQNSYAPKITITTDPVEGDAYEIDGTVDFEITIDETQAAARYDIDQYQAAVKAVFVKGNAKTGQDVEIVLQPISARKWGGSLQLADNRGEYPIKASLYVGGHPLLIGSDLYDVVTINFIPEAVNPYIEQTVYIEPLPFLDQETTQPYAVALEGLFTDKNKYDSLTFSMVSDGSAFCAASLANDNTVLKLEQFLRDGEQQFTITAKDTSGATAETIYKVIVISHRQQALKLFLHYGPIVAIALIAFFLLYWWWKPSFKRMSLSSYRNGNNHMAAIRMKNTKRKLSLSLYADDDMLKLVNMSRPQLMNILLKPRRNSIYVLRNKKPLNGATVSVDGKVFNKKRKKYNLKNGGEILISYNNQTISWRLSINPNQRRAQPAAPPVRSAHVRPR
jgi:hypothetical protein